MSTQSFEERSSAWTGWVLFAGAVLFIVGCLNVIQGLAALLRDDVYLVSKSGLLVTTSFSYWGWALIIWGGVMVLVALGLFAGNEAARWFGIFAVAVNLLMQFSWFTSYPLWSMVVIALDAAILYGLTVGWGDVKAQLTRR
jgi:hypothetical protein